MKSWLRIMVAFIGMAAFGFTQSAAASCDGNCLTTTLSEHQDKGRALYLPDGPNGSGYYAKDGVTFMGAHGDDYASMGMSQEKVQSFSSDGSAEVLELFWSGSGNEYGVVFVDHAMGSVFVIMTEIDDWYHRKCDSDCDVLEDSWEMNMYQTMGKTADNDMDHDGFSDIVESVTGSDPNDGGIKPIPGNFFEHDAKGRIRKMIRVNETESAESGGSNNEQ